MLSPPLLIRFPKVVSRLSAVDYHMARIVVGVDGTVQMKYVWKRLANMFFAEMDVIHYRNFKFWMSESIIYIHL